ncbi:hypothetical protein [Bifidobacterium sp. SO1]|uniref:hypothetical protein n=1 Tax=Bifidobacterium sp. SO1 TaxID=2809029 RepID=UPI001BDD6D16|nr:hypothetical protein [Bifidobacterium sp. SO1]MBT1161734.1 hypothetical protein [Bifidobacterium sp. SO1]
MGNGRNIIVMPGEHMVRLLCDRIHTDTGETLSADAVGRLIRTIGDLDGRGTVNRILDESAARTTDPATLRLILLLESEDRPGTPFGTFAGRAEASHLTAATGLICRTWAERYHTDEHAERDTIRRRLASDPEYARELILDALTLISLTIRLSKEHPSGV